MSGDSVGMAKKQSWCVCWPAYILASLSVCVYSPHVGHNLYSVIQHSALNRRFILFSHYVFPIISADLYSCVMINSVLLRNFQVHFCMKYKNHFTYMKVQQFKI